MRAVKSEVTREKVLDFLEMVDSLEWRWAMPACAECARLGPSFEGLRLTLETARLVGTCDCARPTVEGLAWWCVCPATCPSFGACRTIFCRCSGLREVVRARLEAPRANVDTPRLGTA